MKKYDSKKNYDGDDDDGEYNKKAINVTAFYLVEMRCDDVFIRIVTFFMYFALKKKN